jgi:hypothetical protein
MGMIDMLNAAGRQAAERARESVREAELAQDLTHAYEELGRVAFALSQQRAITHPQLIAITGRIRDLQSQLAELHIPRDQGAGRKFLTNGHGVAGQPKEGAFARC